MTLAAQRLIRAHRGLLGPPSFEDVVPSSISSYNAGINEVVGAANTAAGARSVVIDGSDSTYIDLQPGQPIGQVSGIPMTIASFTSVVAASGRNISSFIAIFRVSTERPDDGHTLSDYVLFDNFTGITTAQGRLDQNIASPTAFTPYDVLLGPWTKSGGGTWTAAQFATMGLFVSVVSQIGKQVRLYSLQVRPTYLT